MRPFTLTAIKTGISRLRTKGGARPDALYDLLNAQMNAAMEIIPRPGSLVLTDIELGAGVDYVPAPGLMYYKGEFHIFAARWIVVDNPFVILHVLPHPTDPLQEIVEVHLAEPFLGLPFVIVEYTNGDVFYFWLTEGMEGGEVWQPDHAYTLNTMVSPTDPNGLFYRATRLNPPGTIWKAGEEHVVGDVVEPTVYNGFEYVCVDVAGTDPHSGTTEPAWIAEDEALVYEDVDAGTSPPPPTGGGGTPIPPELPGRYGDGPNFNTAERQL